MKRLGPKANARKPEVQSITSAPTSAEDDIRSRTRNYLITMVIRTVCFILAVFTEGWVRWTCVALAVVLPYIAVVLANARAPRAPGDGPVITAPHDRRLER